MELLLALFDSWAVDVSEHSLSQQSNSVLTEAHLLLLLNPACNPSTQLLDPTDCPGTFFYIILTSQHLHVPGPLSSSNWAVAAFGLLSLTSWEVCRRSRASEHAKMKALMEDYRTKVKQKNSSSTSLTSEENDNNTNYDEKHVKGPHIGGVFIGEKGKEILRDNAVNTSSANTPNEKVERYV